MHSTGFTASLVVRADSDPERMPITIARYLPVAGLIRYAQSRTYERDLGLVDARQSHDFVASVFTLFGAMAIGLAALGIYGIVAHSVAERKRELGVRIALGATARDVVNAVIREGNPVALAGVAIGLYFTKHSVAWLHAFSLDGDENDAVLFALVALALFLVAVIAALPPALRATRIDPVESLRSE
jgi:ABC-type antimicrobial peptide transport system permease subunit